MQWNDSAYKDMIADLTAIVASPVLGLLGATNLKVAPITASTNMTRTAVIGDVTLATFAGSTPQAVTFNVTPILNSNNEWEVAAPSVSFVTDGAIPETVIGMVWVTGAGPYVLKGQDIFETPIPLTINGQGFEYLARAPLPVGPWTGGVPIS